MNKVYSLTQVFPNGDSYPLYDNKVYQAESLAENEIQEFNKLIEKAKIAGIYNGSILKLQEVNMIYLP